MPDVRESLQKRRLLHLAGDGCGKPSQEPELAIGVAVPRPDSYPPPSRVGLPQFRLFGKIKWVFVLDVKTGLMLTRALSESARW